MSALLNMANIKTIWTSKNQFQFFYNFENVQYVHLAFIIHNLAPMYYENSII